MNWKDWVSKKLGTLRTAAASAPDAERAAIQAEIAELESVDAPTAPLTAASTGNATGSTEEMIQRAVNAVVGPLQSQITELGRQLADEKSARKEATDSLAAQRTQQRESEITAALDRAIAAGKIPQDKRDGWHQRLEKDFDTVLGILDELPESAVVNKAASGGDKGKDAAAKAPTGKQYQDTFSRSIPATFMDYVEKSISQN